MPGEQVAFANHPNFQVEYDIGPWMEIGSVDQEAARFQWRALIDAVSEAGGVPVIVDMPASAPSETIFIRDQYLILPGKRAILANFMREERQGQSEYYEAWLNKQGYEVEYSDGVFEGGNTRPFNGRLYVGVGVRATNEDCQKLEKQTGIEVVPLEVTTEELFHIDIGFFKPDNTNLFVFEEGFSAGAIRTLGRHAHNLVPLSAEEVARGSVAGNSIKVANTVITPSKLSSFQAKVKELGYDCKVVDLSQYETSGAGADCLSNDYNLEWYDEAA